MRPSFYISREITLRTELKNYIDKADSLGYNIPDFDGRIALNTLIIAMINCGFWQEADLILNFAFNNTNCNEQALINMKKVTDTLAVAYGGLTYEESGYLGNEIDGYINSSYNPLSYGGNYTVNNAGVGLVIYSDAGGIISGNSVNNYYRIQSANTTLINLNTDNLPTNANMAGLGYKGYNKTDSTSMYLYNKSTELIKTVTNVGSILNTSLLLLRHLTSYYASGITLFHAGAPLINAITQAFRTAYNIYLTTIGLTAFA